MNEMNNIPIFCEINTDIKMGQILINEYRPGNLYFDYICQVSPENIIIIERYNTHFEYLFSEVITVTSEQGCKKVAVINNSDWEDAYYDAKVFKMNIIKLTSEEREIGIENLLWSDGWLYNKVTNKIYITQEEFEEAIKND